MNHQLTEKDKKTIKFGAVAVAIILAWFVIDKTFLSDWQQIRHQLKIERQKYSTLGIQGNQLSAKQAGLLATVPVLEMPQAATKQQELFRGTFNNQLKKAGINVKTLRSLPVLKAKDSGGHSKMLLQCQGKCNSGQIFSLLASLYENPYFVGVEELQLKCDAKNRSEIDLKLTVSTFVK